MSEPTRTAQSRSSASAARRRLHASYEGDVLLIADEPRRQDQSGGRQGKAPAGLPLRPSPPEPLDVETVVRKLIALLSEEAQL